MHTDTINRRSLMVFSALAHQRWDEVMALGADLICFDLEDGTARERKDEARDLCLAQFESKLATAAATPGPVRVLLRINSPRTLHGIKDLAAVAQMDHPPHGLVLPKVECAEDVNLVAEVLAENHAAIELIPLIESQAGVRNARQIAGASDSVSALFLGSVDLSGELGSNMGWDALYRARSQLVEATSESGIDCIDGVWLDAHDQDGLQAELIRLAAMGFTGKASYDAVQLTPIHAAFTPSVEQVDFACRVIAAVASSETGGARVDGRSVNKANAKAAARVVELARRRGGNSKG